MEKIYLCIRKKLLIIRAKNLLAHKKIIMFQLKMYVISHLRIFQR